MSIPLPLAVRFYQFVSGLDRYVTQWVDDISFRSVVPGGYASADITLRVPRGLGGLSDPDPLGFSRLTDLFTRIQVIDVRTMEIAWEGRIEDPARQVEPDVWQIGALGSMVAATDVERPVFYVDSSVDGWNGEADFWEDTGAGGAITGDFQYFDNAKDENRRMLTTKVTMNLFIFADGGPKTYSWRWDSHGYDQAIARFATTHDGGGPNAAQDNNYSVIVGIAANAEIDVSEFTSGALTKTNVIGTDFTDPNARYVVLGIRRDPGSGDYVPGTTAGDKMEAKWWSPAVVGLRQDRTGAKLVAAASYPGNYVTVSQVVEDVVGRFLVSGWYDATPNQPWPGSVRPADCYIDASSTTQIKQLTYPDGTTAAAILDELIEKVQTDAYWGIWESRWGACNPEEDQALTRQGMRFEFAKWPTNWGYVASSVDGFEGQPNGERLTNFISYRYRDEDDVGAWHVDTEWLGISMPTELYNGGFTRAITVVKEEPTSAATAAAEAFAYLANNKRALNAGTLTVRRPIYFYDDGSNGWSGGSRMLDPWMLKPGKLIRITDVPARTMYNDLRVQPNAPNAGIDGTLYKVVGTEFNSARGECRLELDQVERWKVSTQIKAAAGRTPYTQTVTVK